MGDDITIGVTEIVNNIEVTAQPNDQIVDISVTDNADNVTLNITPTVVEVNINKGSSFAQWGDLYGTLSDQTDLQNALNLKANLVDGKVPASELPSYVDDIIEVANYAALPATGEIGKIYVTLDNNKIYRWSGSVYIEIASNSAIWGAITGTLSSQTDLVNALNLRVPYTGATSNVNLGEYGLTSGFLGLDTTPTSTPTGIGTIYWDAANRTAALIDGDGDTTLQIGQEQRILVHNNTGSTLTDGQVVYVTGSTGNVPSVSLANASSETTSAATIGVVTESIAQGADGFITTSGIVNGLNTLAFNEGDLLWLGTTAGTFTATKPISPNHLVLIGYVIKKAGGNGSILVKIQNTQELEESSDVLFTSLANNQVLTYESATDLWKNKSIATVLGYTPANDASVVKVTTDQNIRGIKTFLGDQTATTLKLIVADYYNDGFITSDNGMLRLLNGTTELFNLASTGDLTAKSFVKTGGTASQFLKADGSVDSSTYALTSQLHDAVTIGTANGLSLSGQVLSLALASPTTRGALTSEDYNYFFDKVQGNGNQNYIPKYIFSGSNKVIGNSQIYDDGTNVGIGTTSPSEKLTVSNGKLALTTDDVTIGGKIYGYNDTSVNLYSGGLKFQTRYFDGSNYVYADRLTLNSSGNVGIGTTNPGTTTANTLLGFTNGSNIQARTAVPQIAISSNIDGDWYAPTYKTSNFASQIFIDGNGGTIGIRTAASGTAGGAITWNNGLRMDSSGNVGIGTTSPAEKLEVQNGTAGAKIKVSNTGGGYAMLECSSNATSTATLSFTNQLVLSGGNVGIGTTSPNSNSNRTTLTLNNNTWGGQLDINVGGVNHAQFGTDNFNSGLSCRIQSQDGIVFNAGGATERMRITSGGSVGIGTTSPGGKLHVVGEGIFDDGTNGRLTFANASSQNDIYSTTTSFGGWKNLRLSSNELILSSGGTTERMRITSGGNVLIGTTSDAGYKLDVNGTGRFLDNLTVNKEGGIIGIDASNNPRIGFVKKSGEQPFLAFASDPFLLKVSSGSEIFASNTFTTVLSIATSGAATFNSTVTATGFFNSSDNRLKDLIDYDYNVSDIKPITYLWKDGRDNKKHVGYSAQEVQKVMPDAVNEGTDGMLSVNYVEVLVAKIAELENRIKQLEK